MNSNDLKTLIAASLLVGSIGINGKAFAAQDATPSNWKNSPVVNSEDHEVSESEAGDEAPAPGEEMSCGEGSCG